MRAHLRAGVERVHAGDARGDDATTSVGSRSPVPDLGHQCDGHPADGVSLQYVFLRFPSSRIVYVCRIICATFCHFLFMFFVNLISVCIYYRIRFILLNVINFNLYILSNCTSYDIY